MIKISEKTLTDLEFNQIGKQLAEACITSNGKDLALNLKPYPSVEASKQSLFQTQEYKSSAFEEKPVPNHGFDAVDKEIKLLKLENSVLELLGFRKIFSLAQTTNIQLRYFHKYQELYPNLYQRSQEVYYTTQIEQDISAIVDEYGEVRSEASALLQQVRRSIQAVQDQLNSSFNSALGHYNSLGFLADIKESVVDNIRVLAVTAMHRKKVKGAVLGSSKTGSIIYIQPERTLNLERELGNLVFEEKEEIRRILKTLTNTIRPHVKLLKAYQDFLSFIDLTAAKVKYAKRMNGVLPILSEDQELDLKEAYHPLLLLSNQAKGAKTYPQSIQLNEQNHIVVISGPNAGGKSISLKTVGLLQLMLQAGMLVPVHEYSRMCFFNKVLTDIGDNQSIENHLSTYSYRLKNMRYFLKQCDAHTLFLIDEFGTGSDPELGGALAETFLEVFYEKKSYGIITTHYANLKRMAQETPGISNANMLFDAKTLEPRFKLHLGEAGSSFTFEVAQKNGIPFSLINRSKKKVERGKLRFDKSIAKLQQERSKLVKTTTSLKEKELVAQKEKQKLDETNKRIQEKLEGFQELYDGNQKLIYLGQKFEDLAKGFFENKKKKEMVAEFLKLVAIENSKRKKANKKEKQKQAAAKKKLAQEAQQKIEKIRQKKKEEKKKEEKKAKENTVKQLASFGINDRVRLEGSRSIGTIDRIEKGKALVNYGMFTTETPLKQLELVQKAKK
ncbi:DNA mismatch repair protein MutS [Mesonia sediminis]|uniref:DNA mismatch repair protein MutS n=1 Tax=Mesonia sediminis TaxID=1703946 RepID=A0ABW5SEX5_9FLAO